MSNSVIDEIVKPCQYYMRLNSIGAISGTKVIAYYILINEPSVLSNGYPYSYFQEPLDLIFNYVQTTSFQQ